MDTLQKIIAAELQMDAEGEIKKKWAEQNKRMDEEDKRTSEYMFNALEEMRIMSNAPLNIPTENEFTIKKEIGDNLASPNSRLNRMVREEEASIERKEQNRQEQMRKFFEIPDRQKLEKKFSDNPLSLTDDEADRLNNYRQPKQYLESDMRINKGLYDESEQRSMPHNDDVMKEIIGQIDQMLQKAAKSHPELVGKLRQIRQLLMKMNMQDNESGQEPVEKMGKKVMKSGALILKAKIQDELIFRGHPLYGENRADLEKTLFEVNKELKRREDSLFKENYLQKSVIGYYEDCPQLGIKAHDDVTLFEDGTWEKK